MIIIKTSNKMTTKNFTVDTVTLSAEVHHFECSEDSYFQSDHEYILQNFKKTRQDKDLIYFLEHENINLKYFKEYQILHIRFRLSELLNKEIYTVEDYEKLMELVKSKLFFIKYIDWENIQLQRIDYKLDYYTEHKELMLKLLHKCKSKHYSLSNQEYYEYNCYYKSKARNINIYDKEHERADKGKEIKDEHENLLRFEVQLKRNYLHKELKQQGIVKTLFNYITAQDAEKHLQTILAPIVNAGDFYNLYHSKKMLTKHYKPKTVNSLIAFQKEISLAGVDAVKARMGYGSFRNKVKQLEAVNVNPIPIPKSDKVTYIENPIFSQMKNTYQELIS